MSPKRHDFAWVAARAECSLDVEFERLKAAVQDDIAARNELVRNDDNIHFELRKREKERRFDVIAYCNPMRSSTVYFMLKQRYILVEDNAEDEIFRAALTLNADGDCRYKMAKGEDETYDGEYLRWQIIQKALEPLFF